jgi:hypothetical protein
MVIFQYRAQYSEPRKRAYHYRDTPKEKDQTFCLTITSDRKDNVKTSFFGRKYIHTIDKSDLKRIKEIVAKTPELFRLPPIEPDKYYKGNIYTLTFAKGRKTYSVSRFNIQSQHHETQPAADLLLRIAQDIDEWLSANHIHTMIPKRFKHEPGCIAP